MMNQRDLIQKIGTILKELQEQQQYVAENPQHLNSLELELFLSNANFLTDHIHILMKAVGQHEVKEIPAATAVVKEEEPATFEFVLKEESASQKFDFEAQNVEEIFNRPLSEEEQQIIARKQQQTAAASFSATPSVTAIKEADETKVPFVVNAKEEDVADGDDQQLINTSSIEEAEVVQAHVVTPEVGFNTPPVVITASPVQPVVEEPVAEVKPVTSAVTPEPIVVAPVAAQPAAEQPAKLTLNEMLANKNGSTMKTEEPRAEISDLRQAISLNDKLLYVKDLFHGYSLAYAEVIELLNKMPDFKSAASFLQKNYAAQNNWSAKPDTVERFYELLKRRFPVK